MKDFEIKDSKISDKFISSKTTKLTFSERIEKNLVGLILMCEAIIASSDDDRILLLEKQSDINAKKIFEELQSSTRKIS